MVAPTTNRPNKQRLSLRWMLIPSMFLLIAAFFSFMSIQMALLQKQKQQDEQYNHPHGSYERVKPLMGFRKEARKTFKKPRSTGNVSAARSNYSDNSTMIQESNPPAAPKSNTVSSTITTSQIKPELCLDPVQRCLGVKDDVARRDRPPAPLDAPLTLALADAALRGGYRNQYMRFVSLIGYALNKGFTQILLPSVRWYAADQNTVPFEILWDVDYWNAQATNVTAILGQGHALPKFVPYDPTMQDWNPQSGLFRGGCRRAGALIRGGRNVDVWTSSEMSNSTQPYGVGGGRVLGTLWYNYLQYQRRGVTSNIKLLDLERAISSALRPSATLQSFITKCQGNRGSKYVALHARVEPYMMVHIPCKQLKVRNLTYTMDLVTHHLDENADDIFVAISMPEMQERYPYYLPTFKPYYEQHKENLAMLQASLNGGIQVGNHTKHVFTCGEATVQFHDNCLEKVVASALNFETAVQADVFVGTPVSSWSTHVWKERLFLSKGHNYEYTPEGLQPVKELPHFRC